MVTALVPPKQNLYTTLSLPLSLNWPLRELRWEMSTKPRGDTGGKALYEEQHKNTTLDWGTNSPTAAICKFDGGS